jgi:parallel beta-helix repeat protein
MFAFPSLIQVGSISDVTYIDTIKVYTESYEHHDQIWIQSDAEFNIQATAEGWTGDGSEGNPYVITGFIFDCESQPLRIWHTTVHWIFIDNVIDGVGDNVHCGTWIDNVTHGSIVDNEIFNRNSGISVAVSDNLNISGNYIHDCRGTGIEFLGGINRTTVEENVIENIAAAGIYSSMSRDCVIKDNTISSCTSLSIGLVGVSPNCNVTGNEISDCESKGIMMSHTTNAFVTENTITNTTDTGIYMNSGSNCAISENTIGAVDGIGFRITDGNDCNVSDNIVENCTGDGILVSSGIGSSVHWNSILNVSGYAINLGSDSSDISVKYNTFIDNGVTCQVCDNGSSNIVSHNYYDDWSFPDVDANGYVDSPYALDGDAENLDEFPLAVAGVVPVNKTEVNPIRMEIILMAGALGTAVIVTAVLFVKRR